jgi:hypothetical protein
MMTEESERVVPAVHDAEEEEEEEEEEQLPGS